MPQEVRFEIPEWVEAENFSEYIVDHMDEYSEALDYTANEHDDRAQVDDVRVTEVDLTEDYVTINYEVDYSAYHGCRDANYADTDEREINGQRQGRVLIFQKFIPQPRRSTHDEL